MEPIYETEAILVCEVENNQIKVAAEELDISRTISIIKRHKANLESREITEKTLKKLSTEHTFSQNSFSLKLPEQMHGIFLKIFPSKRFDVNGNLVDKDPFMAKVHKIRTKQLRVEEIPFTNFIRIKTRSKKPEMAALLANTFSQVYIDWILKFEKDKFLPKIEFIEQQLEITKEKLNFFEKKREEFKQREGLSWLRTDTQKKFEIINLLETSSKLEIQLTKLRNSIITSDTEPFDSENMRIDKLKKELGVSNILEHLNNLFIEKIELEFYFTDGHPTLQEIDELILKLKNNLNDHVYKVYVATTMSLEFQDILTEYLMVETRYKAINWALKKVKQEQWVMKEKYLPSQEREIVGIDREISIQEILYKELILNRKQLGFLFSRKVPESVRVSSWAPIIHKPKTSAIKILVSGFILSLVIAFIGATIFELAQSDLHNRSDLADYFKIPILGIVPKINNILKLKIRHQRPYELICSHIQKKCSPQVFQVTSAKRAEGKTVTAINLAKMLAFYGEKVLLIEATPNNKNLYNKFFKIKHVKGFVDVCHKGFEAKNVIYDTQFDRLSVLPFGNKNKHRKKYIFDLTAKGKLKELIIKLKTVYQIIIIDSPSLDNSYDALSIGKIINHTVLIVSAKNTKKEIANYGKNLLNNAGVNISGIILNNLEYVIPGIIYKILNGFKFK